MKRLLPAFLIAAAVLFGSTADAQIFIHGRINLPVPPIPPIPHISLYANAAPYYYGGERYVVPAPRRYYDRDDRYEGYRDRDFRFHEERRERREERRERRHW